MTPDLEDTIVAISSAAGPGARAIVRLTGPQVAPLLRQLIDFDQELPNKHRELLEGQVRLPDSHAPLPVSLLFWPGPHTYTGQDLAELHLVSSPPLVELLITQCLQAGARTAQPGEFTQRAFLAGKLDLAQAEAVLGVVEAGSRDELKQALVQLAGGLTRPLEELRDDMLNLLADVEAGLDFAEEDLQFVEPSALLRRIAKGLALVTNIQRQVGQRGAAEGPFRVVVAGRPNAGKSSLFNAMLGETAALVSAEQGTTRDYLEGRLYQDGVVVELVDTAGWHGVDDPIDNRAEALGRRQLGRADLILLCIPAGTAPTPEETEWLSQSSTSGRVAIVATKCDLAEAREGWLATCAARVGGVESLKQLLVERARTRRTLGLGPSLSRCRHHLEGCLKHLRQAHTIALHEEPPELLAAELRATLDELGALVGTIYTDDLLDRIFSRFCIGK